MKSKILTIIVLCFAKTLFAQDSVRIETVVDTAFKTPQYIVAYDDVFLSHKETKWLLKFDPMAWLVAYDGGIGDLRMEFERKLNQSFSINTSTSFQISNPISLYPQSRNIMQSFGFSANIEGRWYYQMAKNIAKNKSANNLNGNYWALKTGVEFIPKGWGMIFLDYVKKDTSYIQKTTKNSTKSLKSYRVEANYGIQKRLFTRGYINFSFGVGLAKEDGVRIEDASNSTISYQSFWRPYLHNRVSFGWALDGQNKKTKPNIESCDLFRCFEEEDKLLKINLLGAIQNLDLNNVLAKTAISYEFWLSSKNNISLNSTLSIKGKFYSSPRTELNAWQKNSVQLFEAKATIEPRYYNKLKKSIAQGKSAHNFSGGYWGLPISYAIGKDNNPQTNEDYQSNAIRPIIQRRAFGIHIVYGIQKKVFKNGYWNISAGPGYLATYTKSTKTDGSGLDMAWRGELGFAF